MGTDKKSISGIIEEIAISTDKLQQVYPNGKIAIIVELDNNSYAENQYNLGVLDNKSNQFKIDISDVEIIFIKENSIQQEIENKEKELVKEPEKKTFFKKISKIFLKKRS